MILSYKDLRKRDVVNIADGRSFGKITDLKLDFPCGTLKGIVVCDRRRCGFLGLFGRNEIFIDEKNIVRIGGDVILVNIRNSDSISPAVVEVNDKGASGGSKAKCPPPVKPPCPPFPPPPPCPPKKEGKDYFYGEAVGTDFEDY